MRNRPLRLFISYAHADEADKERLRPHLSSLVQTGLIDPWDDRKILAGSDWLAEIESAMAGADAALFLLSPNFIASGFCLEKEVPTLLERHREQGVLILYILVADCLWEDFDFIQRVQLLPRDARPISKQKGRRSDVYTSVLREIRAALKTRRPRPGLAAPEHPTPTDGLAALLTRLPGATRHLFGREAELAQLDGWQSRRGVFLWVAPGGTGKSALTRWWLEHREWPAGTRFIGHSFYSQGSHQQATSARGFLSAALKELEIAFAPDTPDDALGRLLAQECARAPSCLVLDGLEPLQQAAPGDPQIHGSVKDRGLAALLEGLAHDPGEAVCLASSRLPVPDIGIKHGPAFHQQELEWLPPAGALALLQQRGMKGSEAELAAMAERLDHHPLALVLAAELCHTFLEDGAGAFLALEWPVGAAYSRENEPADDSEIAATSRSHAATVMALFDQHLAAEHQALDRELVRILGLFDRPAPWGALLALQQQAPPIPGLTEQLHRATPEALAEALARLRQWGLVQAELERTFPEGQGPELDAHPLVREHFGGQLEREAPGAWRAAHRVLFDWFCALPEKEQPDTLEALEPLYRAVGHGCRAGAYDSALNKVYYDRIYRGNQGYSLFQLGAYSSDLAALAGFFADPGPGGWTRLRPMTGAGPDPDAAPGEAVSEADRSWLLALAAFCLMSLGRLKEAIEPRNLVRYRWRQDRDWNNFCLSSNGLMDLQTPLGRWGEAEAVAQEALEAAGRIKDAEECWQRTREARAYLGHILHGAGRLEEARAAFGRAEAVQAESRPHEPKLYSLGGFFYAQILLEQTRHPEALRAVLERGRYALEIDDGRAHLSRALNHCTIGQALSALGDPGAGAALDRAVATMQRAGKSNHLPKMHLARAHHLRRATLAQPDPQPLRQAAWTDHAKALSIARRGNMRTYLAECALLAGNLHLDAGEVPDAAARHAEAARLIREDGYGRREAELHLLQARLLHHESDPAGARRALAAAEARIRGIGQWGLWPELHRVGEEIGGSIPAECPAEG